MARQWRGVIRRLARRAPRPAARRSRGLPWVWGAREAEVQRVYGCDRLASGAREDRLVRAITVAAPAATVFAWLGNLRVAPYSYDWLDNLGRRSPRALATDLGPVAAGQRVMYVFTVEEAILGQELTVRTSNGPGRWLFGDVRVSYHVAEKGPSQSRLIAVLRLRDPAGLARAARKAIIAWGDLLMMRRQLMTLRDLAEEHSREAGAQGRVGDCQRT